MRTISIYPDSWAALNAGLSGQKYKPGNGTEGALFLESWCGRCSRDHGMILKTGDGDVCQILADTYFYDVSDPRYPSAWQYGAHGQPQCAMFSDASQPPPERDEHTIDMFADKL